MTKLRLAASATTCLAALMLAPTPSFAQSCDAGWKCKVSYGASTVMDLYVPTKLAASPPIVVALHYCGGNSGSAHPWFKQYADQYGFVIIAPSAGGNCFDATPQRSGERDNIVKMVQYVVTQNSADTKRVFAAGASSGACMTQALLAAYPDVFAAGSSLAGVPAGAWTGGNAYGWSTPAGTTAAQWGDKVRNADPGFSGTRPRIQLWQGQGDTTLTYSQNYPAEVAQWTNVAGLTDADGTKSSVKPPGAQDTWDRTSYKNSSGVVVVEANSGPSNVPHDLTGRGLWADVVRFFGLDSTSGTGGTGGMGGAGNSGGAANGGAVSSAGATSASGGTSAGGSTNSGSGGAAGSVGQGSGGNLNRGGSATTGSGGAQSGGAQNNGGTSTTSASGGSATGGKSASGGASTTSVGGAIGNGGASSAGSDGGTPDNNGCNCSVAGDPNAGSWSSVFAALATLAALHKRRSSRA